MLDNGLARSDERGGRRESSDLQYNAKSGRPYVADVVATYHNDTERFEHKIVLDDAGSDRRITYSIFEGDYAIIGALTPDRSRIMDAAVAFRGIAESGEEAFFTKQMHPSDFRELSETKRITLEPGILELVEGQRQEQKPALALRL